MFLSQVSCLGLNSTVVIILTVQQLAFCLLITNVPLSGFMSWVEQYSSYHPYSTAVGFLFVNNKCSPLRFHVLGWTQQALDSSVEVMTTR